EMNPTALNQYGIALETVRSALAATTQNRPKGQLGDGTRASEIASNDQLLKAAEYAPVIIAYRSGRPVRLSDVAQVEDSVEDVRTTGLANGRPAVLLVIFRQPGANIIDTVDGVRRLLPELQAAIPRAITMSVVMDQTQTIRGSLSDHHPERLERLRELEPGQVVHRRESLLVGGAGNLADRVRRRAATRPDGRGPRG